MAAKRSEIMTMDDLAEYLKISKSTLYKLATEGKLPGQKIGKRWRFHRAAVDRWLPYAAGQCARRPCKAGEDCTTSTSSPRMAYYAKPTLRMRLPPSIDTETDWI